MTHIRKRENCKAVYRLPPAVITIGIVTIILPLIFLLITIRRRGGLRISESDRGGHDPTLYGIHDPSAIILDGGVFHVYSTGGWGTKRWPGRKGLRHYTSTDLRSWTRAPDLVFRTKDGDDPNRPLWAPDIVAARAEFKVPCEAECDRYFLFYSVSTWGSMRSCVRVAIGRPSTTWRDGGSVVCSDDSTARHFFAETLFQIERCTA